jgi:type II secretory pathway pseudopilin PulG
LHKPARLGVARVRFRGGYTFVELFITLVCLALAAALVVPNLADTAPSRLQAAAEILIADVEFAQTQTLAHADDPRTVVFDASANSYTIAARSDPSTPLLNPIGQQPYVTRFGSGRAAAAARVQISTTDLGGDQTLSFGSCGQLDQLAAASVTLECSGRRLTVSFDPITGQASVTHIQ